MTPRGGEALFVPIALAAACAAAGSTVGSGVGDALLERPPYYAGARATPAGVPGTRVGILPIYFQPGDAEASMFAPSWTVDSQVGALLQEMNAYIDSLTTSGGTRPLKVVEGTPVSAVAPMTMGVPPDVRFGCLTDLELPEGDCASPEDGALGRGGQYMKLAVGRPSSTWVEWASEAMEGWGVEYMLVLTLELGEYLPRQRGLLGHKSVELGTEHAVDLPWLTSLETPVLVLQITGALVDRAGRAARIGAEGLLPKRTRLRISALGAQALWSDVDVAELRGRRREDLDGRPLVWREAMRRIVKQLTI